MIVLCPSRRPKRSKIIADGRLVTPMYGGGIQLFTLARFPNSQRPPTRVCPVNTSTKTIRIYLFINSTIVARGGNRTRARVRSVEVYTRFFFLETSAAVPSAAAPLPFVTRAYIPAAVQHILRRATARGITRKILYRAYTFYYYFFPHTFPSSSSSSSSSPTTITTTTTTIWPSVICVYVRVKYNTNANTRGSSDRFLFFFYTYTTICARDTPLFCRGNSRVAAAAAAMRRSHVATAAVTKPAAPCAAPTAAAIAAVAPPDVVSRLDNAFCRPPLAIVAKSARDCVVTRQ